MLNIDAMLPPDQTAVPASSLPTVSPASVLAPGLAAAAPQSQPIDRLRPSSDLHKTVLEKLCDRIKMSEAAMRQLQPRWNYNEKAVQAYLTLPEYEARLKAMSEEGKKPQLVSIVIPYAYATLEAQATYLAATVVKRRPIFTIQPGHGTLDTAARKMEQVVQYNADHARLARELYQGIWDTGIYSFGVTHNPYVQETGVRTVLKHNPMLGTSIRSKETKLTYSGNKPRSIDPFKFLPDPRVPISRVNREGEFVFYWDRESSLTISDLEADGVYKWVDAGGQEPPSDPWGLDSGGGSQRTLRTTGAGDTSHRQDNWQVDKFLTIHRGTVRLIPSKWGLGEGNRSEIWLFTILNKRQIIQAQPLDMDHGMHPIAATEPWSFGYDFGQLASADFLIPFQEAMSWLFNSRMHNVRTSVNNLWLIDPSRVESKDVDNPHGGKFLRLKKTFYGQDVRQAVTQFPVNDVTSGHMGDLQAIYKLADAVTGINDNMRGIQNPSGRRSATEARLSLEAGMSRLTRVASKISADMLVDLAEQMVMNIQQFMPEEMAINILGADGSYLTELMRPEMLVGDFNFPVSDGSLPFDKIALLDVWQQILMGVAGDPELRMNFSVPKIFKYVAQLGGADNIDQFANEQMLLGGQVRRQVLPNETIEAEADKGNLVPIPQEGLPM